MLNEPESDYITVPGLCALFMNNTMNEILSAVTELVEKGYVLNFKDDCKAEPECSYPHRRNAYVAYVDVENPHLEKPHVKNRSNNKYINNQISKKEISSDYNINPNYSPGTIAM